MLGWRSRQQGAIAGLGVVLLPSWIGDPLVAANKLEAILPRFSSTSALHVLTHGGRHLPRRVALLRDFLYGALTQVCGKHT
jgi:DNA-binding transcriptional LysR family regulator